MNYKEIMELSQWVEKSAFTTYSLSLGAIHVSMSKQATGYPAYPPMPMQGAAPIYHAPLESNPAPTPPAASSTPPTATAQPAETPKTQPSGHIITSPIVGTYYESSSPDKPAFVKVGQAVKKGDVLCILEAMKIMNEITSDVDGTIAEILVANGDMVEAKMPLFRIEV